MTTNAAGSAALKVIRPAMARIDTPRSPDDLAADLIEIWDGVETALRKMLGGSSLSGPPLVRELCQRELITLDQAHAVLELLAVCERCEDVSYKPTPDDAAAAKAAFAQLEAEKPTPLPATSTARDAAYWARSAIYYLKFGFVFIVLFLYLGTGLWMIQDDKPPAEWYLFLLFLIMLVGVVRKGLRQRP